MTSRIAIALVRAAKTSITKKTTDKNAPPVIWASAVGRVTKSNPGPAPGSMPNVNTMGKITRDAARATSVSAPAVASEAEARSSCDRR